MLRLDIAIIVFIILGLANISYGIFWFLAQGGLEGYAMAAFTVLQGVAWFFVAQMYEEKA